MAFVVDDGHSRLGILTDLGHVFAELVDAVHKSGFRTDHLDRALRGVGMLPDRKESRDWDTRCRGALRAVRLAQADRQRR